jgi:regulator of sigma E protease
VADLRVLHDSASRDELAAKVEIERDGQRMVVTGLPKDLTVFELADSIAGEANLESNVVSPRVGMPAAAAGMLAGDRILRVGDQTVTDWEEIYAAIQANGRTATDVVVEREGAKGPVTLRIEPGGLAQYPTLGYGYAIPQTPQKETNLVSAMAMGWRRTVLTMESVLLTVRSLITQRVSVKKLGGPIMIAEITYKVQESGWARFLYILAIISINLAILNLLPIPVLDGGQIVLLVAEKIRGKPLPERVVGALQLVGLVLILGLMALVFTNDITRLFQ